MTSPAFDSEKISYEEFKESFMNYVKENTDNKHITLAKSKHITEVCNRIECLVCLDTMSLWKYRNFFSTFDLQGKYEIVNCHNCSDGKVSSYSDTNVIKENKIKVLPFPCGSFQSMLYELEKMPLPKEEVDESIPLWHLCKDENLSRTIHKKSAEVDILNLSEDITNLLQIHVGNLLQMPSLISNLDMKFSFSNSVEKTKNQWYEEINDVDGKTIYIMFRLEKEVIGYKGHFSLFRFTGKSSKQLYSVRITILKPKNKMAQKSCDELINFKTNDIIRSKMMSHVFQ